MVSYAYDRTAESYDDDWNGLYAESTRRAVAQIAPQFNAESELKVVDLAVGTGNTLNALYRRMNVAQATGFDVSSGMLGKAAQKLPPRTRLIHYSAENAEDHLVAGSLDLVLCFFLLRYLDPAVVLPIAHRLLKPGGVFCWCHRPSDR